MILTNGTRRHLSTTRDLGTIISVKYNIARQCTASDNQDALLSLILKYRLQVQDVSSGTMFIASSDPHARREYGAVSRLNGLTWNANQRWTTVEHAPAERLDGREGGITCK